METVKVVYTGQGEQFQAYSPQDTALISTVPISGLFNSQGDYIECYIKDLSGEVLDVNYNVTDYTIGSVINPDNGTTTELYLDPRRDAGLLGYTRGVFDVKYNFFRTHLASSPLASTTFWIKEVSTSRTEIKAARQDLSNAALLDAFGTFNAALSADAYYPTFYLNFGQDIQVIGVNAIYVEEDGIGYVIFKLYEPLPDFFDVKSTFWVVTQVANPVQYNIAIEVTPPPLVDSQNIKGPNFKVKINDSAGQTTPYYNYASLLSTSVSSSYQQLQSLMAEKGIQINTDYSNFENFIHFSSATERLYNFTYKLAQIESASFGLTQTNTTQAKISLQKQIDSIITNFDGWEYYLYFTSESTAWPKKTTDSPYILYSVSSSQASNWLGSPSIVPTPTTMSMYWSSSYYDDLNKNWLLYTTPQYILDDDANAPYLAFLNMIGQHFDNIWIYYKDVTNRYAANNNPFVGISMDQVSEALQSFGIQLYTNTNISDNLYYSIFGINQTGSNLPVTSSAYSTTVYQSSSIFPLAGQSYLTASLFLPPFEEEKIRRYVLTFPSASSTQTSSFETLPAQQLTDEVYKRIYHNLPYLLKTRGTERGARALVTAFGIPESILTTHEYGGYNIYQVAGIQEIDNIKIVTGSVAEISSSLLSPFVTIQYYNNDLDKSSITVQTGFSPTDSINASITSSGYVTSSTQPGYFNIMQLIGDPNLQYSSSYTPLVDLSNVYFDAEYTSRYNVWDFIRIIKYYNNSLFKMLRDWYPARASGDTGIVVKSHMLERNKYPRKEPTVSTSSYDADYDLVRVTGSDGGAVQGNTYYVEAIPITYPVFQTGSTSAPLSGSLGTVYLSSSNDIQKYTGEFSGSYISISDNSFSQLEVSSYYYPWTSSVPYPTEILFLTYSVSPLFQNISGAVLSQRVLDLDYNSSQFAPVNYGLITQSMSQSLVIGPVSQSIQPYSQYAQYQDFNHISRPYIIPRYSGSYLSGLRYNVYSTQSATYPGDISYGQSPVIDYVSRKVGLFTQIVTSSFLPNRVNVSLPYLADVSGGLSELNQNNRNWEDVQNIFKAGTTATIKQFDNKKYSNQVSTDGVKSIYSSGYNFTPQLYFNTASTPRDTKLYFQYTGDIIPASFVGYNSLTPSTISGSGTINYPVVLDNAILRSGNIYNIFDAEDPTSTEFAPGILGVFPSYTASQGAQRTFRVNFGVNFQFQDPEFFPIASGSYSFGAYLEDTTLIGELQTVNFTSSYTGAGISTGSFTTQNPNPTVTGTPSFITQQGRYNGPFNWRDGTGGPVQTIGSENSQLTASVYSYIEGGLSRTGVLITAMTADLDFYLNNYISGNPSLILGRIDGGGQPTAMIKTFTATKTFDYTTPPISLGPDDKVVFRFRQTGMSTSNFTSSLTTSTAASSLTTNIVSVGQGGYAYATASLGPFISGAADLSTFTSEIILSEDLTQYLGYQFVPYFTSASIIYSSSLYERYGDVNVSFNPQLGDKLVLTDINGITQEVDVLEATTVVDKLHIVVTPQLLDNWVLTPKIVNQLLILRRYKDEQNVILTFNKTPGATSYGLLLPNTVSPQVIDNINTLQAAVQSQLLSNQVNTSTNL
jgi:hypothetical protein